MKHQCRGPGFGLARRARRDRRDGGENRAALQDTHPAVLPK